MDEFKVNIVELPALRVAAALGFGEGPEGLSQQKLIDWARALGLMEDGQEHRFFGFNNPSPTPGSANYGYEMWMTVGPQVQGSGEVSIKEFPGGLYAVTRVVNVENTPGAWTRLVGWLENSPYRAGRHQWLEEHIQFLGLHYTEYVIDLYLPVVR